LGIEGKKKKEDRRKNIIYPAEGKEIAKQAFEVELFFLRSS